MKRKRWDYMVVVTWTFTEYDRRHRTEYRNNLRESLNYLGSQGWELVSYSPEIGVAVLKQPFRKLRATTDIDLYARTAKILYSLLNAVGWRGIRRCHKEDFWCEWVYPYGFVPEAGCPRHD